MSKLALISVVVLLGGCVSAARIWHGCDQSFTWRGFDAEAACARLDEGRR